MAGALDNSAPLNHRIDFLDGLRGVAILMVITLHYIVQIEQVPGVDYYKDSPLRLGYFGVQLFFIISGYVIFMTLDKTPNFARFIVQRWIRLFPAMLVGTLFICAVSYFMVNRIGGIPRFVDLVPGLTLAGANVVSAATGVDTEGLERGFWSLYVEFRYYLMFGALFFMLGRQRAFFALLILSLALLCGFEAATLHGGAWVNRGESLFGKMLIGFYLPWFLFGMYAYLYRFHRYRWVPVLLALNGLAYHLQSIGTVIMALGIPLFTFALFRFSWLQAICRSRFLLFMGSVSYPLYLINDSVGRGGVRTMYWMADGRVPYEVFSFVMLALILIPSWIIAKFIEPRLQRLLKRQLLGRGSSTAPTPSGVAAKEA